MWSVVLSIQFLFFVVTYAEIPTVTLHNAAEPGLQMPVVGLGTGGYWNYNDTWASDAITTWLKLGGPRLDCAYSYTTEPLVGPAIFASGVARESIFVTSKVESFGYQGAMDQFKTILKDINTTYIDLLLIHWPGGSGPSYANCSRNNGTDFTLCRQDTWRALEDLFAAKKVRAIGVSNFEVNHLVDIISMGGLIPAVNQVEFHAYWHEDAIVDYCNTYNITFNTYSPLGAPDFSATLPSWKGVTPVLQNAGIVQIANALNKSPAQIALRWAIQQGLVVNPRSHDPKHMLENLDIFNFELSTADLANISFLFKPKMYKVCPDPRLIL